MALTTEQTKVATNLQNKVVKWLENEDARSSLAGAVVVIDYLSTQGLFEEADLFSPNGQISRGRGNGLIAVLAKYGENRVFLKDGVTTRSTLKFRNLADELNWGKDLSDWSAPDRDEATKLIMGPVLAKINLHFLREKLKMKPDKDESPVEWIKKLLQDSSERSQGRVEQHLVGAKLQKRLPNATIGIDAAFAGDVQTSRPGDFVIGKIVFHVTAAPALPVIQKCEDNIRQGFHPILNVPSGAVQRAIGLVVCQR